MLDADTVKALTGIARTQLVRWRLYGDKIEIQHAAGATRRVVYRVDKLAEHIAALPVLPAGLTREAHFYASLVGLADLDADGESGPLKTTTPEEARVYVLGFLAGLVAFDTFLEVSAVDRHRVVENFDACI